MKPDITASLRVYGKDISASPSPKITSPCPEPDRYTFVRLTNDTLNDAAIIVIVPLGDGASLSFKFQRDDLVSAIRATAPH